MPEETQEQTVPSPSPSQGEGLPRNFPFWAWGLIFGLFVLGIAFIYLYFLQGSFQVPPPQEVDIAELRVGYGVPFAGFIPSGEGEDTNMVANRHIFQGLVGMDENFLLKPLLAESWENPDDLTWRIHLREGVTFHDGSSFKAEDVVYSWEQATGNSWEIGGDSWARVASIEVIDDYTLDLKTSSPDPVLLNYLVIGLIVSKSYSEGSGFENPNGTGPYRFANYEEDTDPETLEVGTLTLEVYENYYLSSPRVKKAIITFYESTEDAQAAFSAGEIEITLAFPTPEEYGQFEDDPEVVAIQAPDIGGFYLGFDHFRTGKTPYASPAENPFRKLAVLQAISYAINIEEVLASVPGRFGVSSTQVIPSQIFGYNPAIERLSYDPERARELLSDAGYPNGFSVTLEAPFPHKPDMEVVAEQLGAVGIETTLVPATDPATTIPRWYGYDVSFFQFGWLIDTGEIGEFWANVCHTPTEDGRYGGDNIGRYSNPDLDAVIEQAATELDPAKRKTLLQQASQIAMDDICVIPLFIDRVTFLHRSNLNFAPRADNRLFIDEISGRP